MKKPLPKEKIYERIAQFDGIVGLYAESLSGGEILEINPQHVLCSASLIKIPILALLLQDVEAGTLDWEAPVSVAAENLVGGTGILSRLDPFYTPTLKTLALLMIILSDNAATNQIIDMIGLNRITPFCEALGLVHTRCERKMMDMQALADGKNNYTCAGEIGRLLSAIAGGRLVSPQASKTIHDIMSMQMYCGKLPAKLPAVPGFWPDEARQHIPPGMVLSATKSGDFYQVEHDVGIFTLPDGQQYILAVMTGNAKDRSEAIRIISDLSLLVYEAMTDSGAVI